MESQSVDASSGAAEVPARLVAVPMVDGDRRSALREHLRAVLREVPKIREQHPDYFEEP